MSKNRLKIQSGGTNGMAAYAAFTEGTLKIDEFKEMKNPLVPKRVEIEQKIIALQTSKAGSARTASKLDFRGKSSLPAGFGRGLGKNEVIFAKSRLEPTFALPNALRFL